MFGAPGRTKSPAPAAAGTSEKKTRSRKSKTPSDPFGADFEGAVPNLRRRFEGGTWTDQEALEPYRALQPCPSCDGARLRAESRAVRVKGRRVADYVGQPIADARLNAIPWTRVCISCKEKQKA